MTIINMPNRFIYTVHFLGDRPVKVDTHKLRDLVKIINEYYSVPLVTMDRLRNIVYERCPHPFPDSFRISRVQA